MRYIRAWAAGSAMAVVLAIVGFGIVSGGEAAAGRDRSVVAEVQAMMAATNTQLAEAGVDYRVIQAELFTADPISPNIVLAATFGNKQLPEAFVAGDARRAWSPSSVPGVAAISFAIDTVDAVALPAVSGAATRTAILAATSTWDTSTPSTNVPLVEAPTFGIDVGIVELIELGGGSPFVSRTSSTVAGYPCRPRCWPLRSSSSSATPGRSVLP